MRNRKLGILNEYIEIIDTSMKQQYQNMSDVPKSPSGSFSTRYANEQRIHHYIIPSIYNPGQLILQGAIYTYPIL